MADQRVVDEILRSVRGNRRRPNPPEDTYAFDITAVQEEIVSRGLKHSLTEGQVINIALELDLPPGDVLEALASWL